VIEFFKLILGLVRSCPRSDAELILENLALRHQLQIALRSHPRPRLSNRDRLLWVSIRRVFQSRGTGTSWLLDRRDRYQLAPQGVAPEWRPLTSSVHGSCRAMAAGRARTPKGGRSHQDLIQLIR
jgi:hypothetical protein